MTKAVMSVMKNTPKVWFGFIFFRPDSVTNQKNLSIYIGILHIIIERYREAAVP
jgi:hypothetical protein